MILKISQDIQRKHLLHETHVVPRCFGDQGVPNRGQAQLDSCCRKKPSSNARHSSQLFYLPVHTVLLDSLRSKCIVLDQLSRGSPPLILWRVKTPFSHFVTCRYCGVFCTALYFESSHHVDQNSFFEVPAGVEKSVNFKQMRWIRLSWSRFHPLKPTD